MRLAVTGSRHWKNRAQVFRVLDGVTPRPTLVIHGEANGVDSFAMLWARANRIHHAAIPPISRERKSDYIARNYAIVDAAEAVIAFRSEGISRGTDATVAYARRQGKLIEPVVTEDPAEEWQIVPTRWEKK